MRIPHLTQEIKGLDKAANTRRAEIKGEATKEERGSPRVPSSSVTVRTRRLTSSEAKNDVVFIGEITVILLALKVNRCLVMVVVSKVHADRKVISTRCDGNCINPPYLFFHFCKLLARHGHDCARGGGCHHSRWGGRCGEDV
jgi:hypothetical protein